MAETSVSTSVEVDVDPATAFTVFTEEIDFWWLRGPANFWDGGRALAKRFEPGVGGRYLEVYDELTGEALEIGRITAWEPATRLVYRSSTDDTEVEVRFEATEAGTRVVVEQRLLPGGDPATAIFLSGWSNILGWFGAWTDDRDHARRVARDLPRLCPVLFYDDVGAALDWLVRVFGLQPRGRLRQPGQPTDFGELALGDSVLMMRRRDRPPAEGAPVSHMVWAYVDDLDEHFARVRAHGATVVRGIGKHGERTYVAADLEGHHWTFSQARPTQRSG